MGSREDFELRLHHLSGYVPLLEPLPLSLSDIFNTTLSSIIDLVYPLKLPFCLVRIRVGRLQVNKLTCCAFFALAPSARTLALLFIHWKYCATESFVAPSDIRMAMSCCPTAAKLPLVRCQYESIRAGADSVGAAKDCVIAVAAAML